MTDERPDDDAPPAEPESDAEVDPGAPLELLAELEEPPRSDLVRRVRASIHRRTLASNAVQFVFEVWSVVLLEFVTMFLTWTRAKKTKGGDEPWTNPSASEEP